MDFHQSTVTELCSAAETLLCLLQSFLTQCLLENLKGQGLSVGLQNHHCGWLILRLFDNRCLYSSKTGFQPELPGSVLTQETNYRRVQMHILKEEGTNLHRSGCHKYTP